MREDGKYFVLLRREDPEQPEQYPASEMTRAEAMIRALGERLTLKEVTVRNGKIAGEIVLFDPFGDMSCDN